jgi:hypothetical protein
MSFITGPIQRSGLSKEARSELSKEATVVKFSWLLVRNEAAPERVECSGTLAFVAQDRAGHSSI